MSTPIRPLAPSINAYSCEFDVALLVPLRHLYLTLIEPTLKNHPHLLQGGNQILTKLHSPQYQFFVLSYDEAPLLWISSNDLPTYTVFKDFFTALDITKEVKPLIDYQQTIVMYNGFFVVGDHLDSSLWHVDYHEGANAFTLITPLFDLNPQHGGLLYMDAQRAPHRYPYKTGEAVFFGDGFSHTTEPYPKSSQRVLLSLTFGTDKIEYWPILERTIGLQSPFLFLPCGHQAGSCECVELKHRTFYVAS